MTSFRKLPTYAKGKKFKNCISLLIFAYVYILLINKE